MATSSSPNSMFQSGVQVLVPAALNRPTHTLYSVCVRVQPTGQEWSVNRRYSQFLQLRKDVLAKLATRGLGCPSCASFHRALAHAAFPRKSLLRSNAVVRRRVSLLQDFLKLLVERVYNDLPKCNTCGEQLKRMTRPFLLRGAQPLHGSILPKIQKSLSLDSYAVVPRSQLPISASDEEEERGGAYQFAATAPLPAATHNLNEFYSSRSADAYQHHSEDSSFDPSRSQRALFSASCTSAFRSLKASASAASSVFSASAASSVFSASKAPSNHSDASEASTQPNESEPELSDSDDAAYASRFDDQRCRDPSIPLEDAMKQVVLPEGARSTVEDVVVRLTSMWAAYDMDEALASLPPERLSQRVSISAASSDEYTF